MNKLKVTNDIIDGLIQTVDYMKVGEKTTICLITLRNGFEIIGHAGCVTKEHYDKDIGESLSYARARAKIWELEGYILQYKLNQGEEICDGCS